MRITCQFCDRWFRGYAFVRELHGLLRADQQTIAHSDTYLSGSSAIYGKIFREKLRLRYDEAGYDHFVY